MFLKSEVPLYPPCWFQPYPPALLPSHHTDSIVHCPPYCLCGGTTPCKVTPVILHKDVSHRTRGCNSRDSMLHCPPYRLHCALLTTPALLISTIPAGLAPFPLHWFAIIVNIFIQSLKHDCVGNVSLVYTLGANLIQTSIYNQRPGSMKITAHQDHTGHCKAIWYKLVE